MNNLQAHPRADNYGQMTELNLNDSVQQANQMDLVAVTCIFSPVLLLFALALVTFEILVLKR